MWDAVIIYDPDGLARRYWMQEMVMDELTEDGVQIFFVTVTAPKDDEEKYSTECGDCLPSTKG